MTKRTPRTDDVIRRARNIILEYEWTQRRLARDKHDQSVLSTSPEAVSFCAVGALQKAQLELQASGKVFFNTTKKLNNFLTIYGGLVQFNDIVASSKEEIIEVFNKALK